MQRYKKGKGNKTGNKGPDSRTSTVEAPEQVGKTGTLLSYFSQSIKAGLACPVTSAERGYGKIKVTAGSLTPSITRQKLCPAAVPVTTRSLQAPLNPPGFMK